MEALKTWLTAGKQEILNTDQGSQFTSLRFTGMLHVEEVTISMEGRGRVYDNIFVERLWRSIKYEEMYLRDYETVREAVSSLGAYFSFYNRERPHQALGYQTPYQLYAGSRTRSGRPDQIHPFPRCTFPP